MGVLCATYNKETTIGALAIRIRASAAYYGRVLIRNPKENIW